jgi:WXG100 family type VII secretion target
MATMNLQIDADQLRAALAEFNQYSAQVETIRKTVDGSIRGIGASWYGPARTSYDAVINNWLEDYQTTVNAPLQALIVWFGQMIEIMEAAEAQNS